MNYDPCGTQRLTGQDILNRLAKRLNIEPQELEKALLELVNKK